MTRIARIQNGRAFGGPGRSNWASNCRAPAAANASQEAIREISVIRGQKLRLRRSRAANTSVTSAVPSLPNFPRYLAPAFTHYLSERLEMQLNNEESKKAKTRKGN